MRAALVSGRPQRIEGDNERNNGLFATACLLSSPFHPRVAKLGLPVDSSGLTRTNILPSSPACYLHTTWAEDCAR